MLFVSARFGVAFLISSFGALTGPPIDGALLGKTFPWSKAIIFSGVSDYIYRSINFARLTVFSSGLGSRWSHFTCYITTDASEAEGDTTNLTIFSSLCIFIIYIMDSISCDHEVK
jgi:hypothetical protein